MTPETMRRLLSPYLADADGLRSVPPSDSLVGALEIYLELLLRWNAKMNLTAVRAPDEIVRRHFGESVLLARLVPAETATLLDLGSGAGFPGIPLQLACPELKVVLAESQAKKASFLREVVRELGLRTEVWGSRAEELPGTQGYDVVALRAVDLMGAATRLASRLGRELLVLGSVRDIEGWGLDVRRFAAVPDKSASVAALCVARQGAKLP